MDGFGYCGEREYLITQSDFASISTTSDQSDAMLIVGSDNFDDEEGQEELTLTIRLKNNPEVTWSKKFIVVLQCEEGSGCDDEGLAQAEANF